MNALNLQSAMRIVAINTALNFVLQAKGCDPALDRARALKIARTALRDANGARNLMLYAELEHGATFVDGTAEEMVSAAAVVLRELRNELEAHP